MTARQLIILVLGIGVLLTIPFVVLALAGDTARPYEFARDAYSALGLIAMFMVFFCRR